jgi:hypothetical protein
MDPASETDLEAYRSAIANKVGKKINWIELSDVVNLDLPTLISEYNLEGGWAEWIKAAAKQLMETSPTATIVTPGVYFSSRAFFFVLPSHNCKNLGLLQLFEFLWLLVLFCYFICPNSLCPYYYLFYYLR